MDDFGVVLVAFSFMIERVFRVNLMIFWLIYFVINCCVCLTNYFLTKYKLYKSEIKFLTEICL